MKILKRSAVTKKLVNIIIDIKIQKYILNHVMILYIFLILKHIYIKIYVMKIVQKKQLKMIQIINVLVNIIKYI